MLGVGDVVVECLLQAMSLLNACYRRCRYRMVVVGDVVVESEYVEPKLT
jgi:hypothetical protein